MLRRTLIQNIIAACFKDKVILLPKFPIGVTVRLSKFYNDFN